MRTFRPALSVWHHELTTVMRDKGILIFILFVPLCYPLLYSYVYTNEVVRDVPAAVVDDCRSTLSRRFVRCLDASPDVRVAARCADMTEARRLLEEQRVYGILHIPANFGRDLWQGDQTHIALYCDMSSMLYYKALMLTATNVSLEINKDIKVTHYLPQATRRAEEVMRMPIDYEYVALFNPQSGFAAFLIPPVLMLIIQQTLFLGIGMAMGDVRERSRAGRLSLPRCYTRPLPVILGKSLLYVTLYLLLGLYMFTFVTRGFGLPRLSGALTFLCFLLPYVLACVFMGMALSFFVYRREDCIMLFVFLSVPLLFLSGVSWPRPAMPAFWRGVSWLFPSTFGMNGYVRMAGAGASLADVRPEYLALWGQAAAYFLLSYLLLRHTLRRHGLRAAR